MVKKVILFPVIKETTYYPKDNEYLIQQGLAGKQREVKGSLLDYDNHSGNVEYIENKVFEDTLTFEGYSRGRSSAVFNFTDSNGDTYQMFMTDIDDLLREKDIINRQVKGTWTFCKRGRNYGIKLCEESPSKENLTVTDIEKLKNMTVSELGNHLDKDINHMALVDGDMSVCEYIRMITY